MYCKKCFVNLDKENHKEWCPEKSIFGDVKMDDIFKGFNKSLDKNAKSE